MSEMVLSVRSQAWMGGKLTLGEQFQKIASHGFKCVNVIFDAGMPKDEESEAVKIFQDLGLHSGQIGVDVGSYNSNPGPDTWTHWLDTGKMKVDLQAKLGGKQILVVGGVYGMGYSWHHAFIDSVAAMQKLCDYAANEGHYVVLEYEPEIHYVNHDYYDTLAYMGLVDRDNFMINLDIGHLHCMQTNERDCMFLRHAMPHCHITDNYGTEHHGPPIGLGTNPIAKWLRFLKPIIEETCEEIGDIPMAGLEFAKRDDVDKEIDRILAHMKEIMPELGFGE